MLQFVLPSKSNSAGALEDAECSTELVQCGKKCGEDTGTWAREARMLEYVVFFCVCDAKWVTRGHKA